MLFIFYKISSNNAVKDITSQRFGAAYNKSCAKLLITKIEKNLAQYKCNQQTCISTGLCCFSSNGIVKNIAFQKLQRNSKNRANKYTNKSTNKIVSVLFVIFLHIYSS